MSIRQNPQARAGLRRKMRGSFLSLNVSYLDIQEIAGEIDPCVSQLGLP